MNVNTSQKIDPAQSELLSRMARTTLQDGFLDSINGSDIYQVTEGWQRETLLSEKEVAVVRSSEEMEKAMQTPDIYTILVIKTAAITQEIAERILNRSPLSKTIFWEI